MQHRIEPADQPARRFQPDDRRCNRCRHLHREIVQIGPLGLRQLVDDLVRDAVDHAQVRLVSGCWREKLGNRGPLLPMRLPALVKNRVEARSGYVLRLKSCLREVEEQELPGLRIRTNVPDAVRIARNPWSERVWARHGQRIGDRSGTGLDWNHQKSLCERLMPHTSPGIHKSRQSSAHAQAFAARTCNKK
jgi:hypothetical protein